MKMKCLIFCLLISCLFFSTVISQSIDVERTHNGIRILLCNSKLQNVDLSYQWYMDNDMLIEDDKFHELRGKLLILKKVGGTHDYKCVIKLKNVGAKFAVSKRIEDNVDLKLYRNKRHKNEALKFTSKMMPNKNFELGSTGKIHCKASGSKSIFWRRNQAEELPNNVEDVNGTLTFNNVDIAMKGIYTCFATNESEQIMHQIEVRILPAFEVVPPEKVNVNEQQSVILDCKGSDDATIKWDFETKMIHTDERFKIYDNGSLYITDVRADDSGRYGCTIGNFAGFKRSESVLFVKQHGSQKPLDEEAEESSSLLSNKAVLLTCSLAVIYIICVVVLMIWCRQRRGSKQRNETDPEQLKLNEDNDQTNDEKDTPKHKELIKSLSSSYTFDIRYEKIAELKKIGTDSNLIKMEILTGFVGDADLPTKVITKDSSVTDEIRMQQQTRVLIRTVKRDQDETSLNEFRRLADLYCNIDSENVVKLFGLSKDSKVYGMILEHGDDFKSFLTEKEDISPNELFKYCQQLVNGVNAIHSAKLVHRDISLNNCIIIKESTIKLTSKTPSTESSDYCEYNGHILPLRHSAPEIIMSCKGKTNLEYSFASDIYALGITMWEILNKGSQPFKSLGKDDLIKKLQTKTLDYNSMGSVADDKVDTVLLKCLKVEPCDRISSIDLLNYMEQEISPS